MSVLQFGIIVCIFPSQICWASLSISVNFGKLSYSSTVLSEISVLLGSILWKQGLSCHFLSHFIRYFSLLCQILGSFVSCLFLPFKSIGLVLFRIPSHLIWFIVFLFWNFYHFMNKSNLYRSLFLFLKSYNTDFWALSSQLLTFPSLNFWLSFYFSQDFLSIIDYLFKYNNETLCQSFL